MGIFETITNLPGREDNKPNDWRKNKLTKIQGLEKSQKWYI